MFKIRLAKVFVDKEQRFYVYAQIDANGGRHCTFATCAEHLEAAIEGLVYEYKWGWGFDKSPELVFRVGQIEGMQSLKEAWKYACDFSAITIPEINATVQVF